MARATVNPSQVAREVSRTQVGVCCTTYGRNALTNTAQAAAEEGLDFKYVRLPVGVRNGRVTSSASGGPTNLDMPALVKWYRDRGVRVIAVMGGRSNDVDIRPGDAERIARELGVDGVDFSSVNEPNNQGWNIDRAITTAQQSLAEIRRVDPNLKIWGPVWSYYNRGDMRRFMDALGSGLAGISYHHYAMGSGSISTAQAMRETPVWGNEIREMRDDLRARGLPERVSVTEINFSWRYGDGTAPSGNNDRFFTSINTVWGASVIGHIVAAGGQTAVYGNQNGPLGVFVEAGNNDHGKPGSSPQPIHWGIGAWTGAKLFPSFDVGILTGGTGPTDDADVEVFAVRNTAGGINLICINKSESTDKDLTVTLTGSNGVFTRWETSATDPYAAMSATGTGEYQGQLVTRLRRMSVSTFVLAPKAVEPEPQPEPGTSWSVSAGSSDAAAPAGWKGDGGVVTGGTAGSNTGTTQAPEGFPEAVFDTERWGPQKWIMPVKAGTYDVALAFSERYAGAQVAGGRVFTVKIGDEIIPNVDVFVQSGGAGKALVIERTVTVEDAITVDLIVDAGGDNPSINAISVTASIVSPPTPECPECPPEVDLTEVTAAYDATLATSARLNASLPVLKKALDDATAAFTKVSLEATQISAELKVLGDAIDAASGDAAAK